MNKLTGTKRNWLKAFHIFFSGAWVGAALSMLTIGFLAGAPESGGELHGYAASVKLIDDYVIIASALGSLFTGLLLSWLTNWGFFKYYWIIVKLAVTVGAVLFGTFFLGPWVNAIEAYSAKHGLESLQNAWFLSRFRMNLGFGSVQALLICAMIFISVLKPWGRRGIPGDKETQ